MHEMTRRRRAVLHFCHQSTTVYEEKVLSASDLKISGQTSDKRYSLPLNHRMTESLRLEKTSKIIKSNDQPNTTMSAKPCPEVQYLHIILTSPGMVTPPLPWAASSNADHSFRKEIFPNIQSKPPLTQLEIIASRVTVS